MRHYPERAPRHSGILTTNAGDSPHRFAPPPAPEVRHALPKTTLQQGSQDHPPHSFCQDKIWSCSFILCGRVLALGCCLSVSLFSCLLLNKLNLAPRQRRGDGRLIIAPVSRFRPVLCKYQDAPRGGVQLVFRIRDCIAGQYFLAFRGDHTSPRPEPSIAPVCSYIYISFITPKQHTVKTTQENIQTNMHTC